MNADKKERTTEAQRTPRRQDSREETAFSFLCVLCVSVVSSSSSYLRSSACICGSLVCLLCLAIDLAQRDAVLLGHAGAILVLRREHRRLAVQPPQLPLHQAPRSRHGVRLAVQRMTARRITANAERR